MGQPAATPRGAHGSGDVGGDVEGGAGAGGEGEVGLVGHGGGARNG